MALTSLANILAGAYKGIEDAAGRPTSLATPAYVLAATTTLDAVWNAALAPTVNRLRQGCAPRQIDEILTSPAAKAVGRDNYPSKESLSPYDAALLTVPVSAIGGTIEIGIGYGAAYGIYKMLH